MPIYFDNYLSRSKFYIEKGLESYIDPAPSGGTLEWIELNRPKWSAYYLTQVERFTHYIRDADIGKRPPSFDYERRHLPPG